MTDCSTPFFERIWKSNKTGNYFYFRKTREDGIFMRVWFHKTKTWSYKKTEQASWWLKRLETAEDTGWLKSELKSFKLFINL